MQNNLFFDTQMNICTELQVNICEMICRVDEYLNQFEHEDFFSFSNTEKRDKIYKQNYYAFISKLPILLTSMENAISRLSALLIRADEAIDLEMITLIGSKIDAYMAFENSLKNFSGSVQQAISKGNTSPSLLINEARRLKLSLENFNQKLTDA
jgi:hypothetical protein